MALSNFGNYGTRSKTIEVPLQQEQVLEVVCDDLPTNPTELTDIFRTENVGLTYYRMLAVKFAFSRVNPFLFFLIQVLKHFFIRLNIMNKMKLNKVLVLFKLV